ILSAIFTARILSCASFAISGRRRNSKISMRSCTRSNAMCSRRASCRRRKQGAGSKLQPAKIAHLRRLADGEDDSEGAHHEAAAEREHEQQPNWEIRQLDHAFTDESAGKHVSDPASEDCQAEQNHCTQPT